MWGGDVLLFQVFTLGEEVWGKKSGFHAYLIPYFLAVMMTSSSRDCSMPGQGKGKLPLREEALHCIRGCSSTAPAPAAAPEGSEAWAVKTGQRQVRSF